MKVNLKLLSFLQVMKYDFPWEQNDKPKEDKGVPNYILEAVFVHEDLLKFDRFTFGIEGAITFKYAKQLELCLSGVA
jgi:hypothetical protein